MYIRVYIVWLRFYFVSIMLIIQLIQDWYFLFLLLIHFFWAQIFNYIWPLCYHRICYTVNIKTLNSFIILMRVHQTTLLTSGLLGYSTSLKCFSIQISEYSISDKIWILDPHFTHAVICHNMHLAGLVVWFVSRVLKWYILLNTHTNFATERWTWRTVIKKDADICFKTVSLF
jgi:hypothetical protein